MKVKDSIITEEEDFVKVDDTWLKISRILLDTLRYELQTARLAPFKEKDVSTYVEVCLAQIALRKGLLARAGEMLCAYLQLDEDQFLYFRGSPSLLDTLDPV